MPRSVSATSGVFVGSGRPAARQAAAIAAVAELRQLQAEYEAWRDQLPESLADSRTAELLGGRLRRRPRRPRRRAAAGLRTRLKRHGARRLHAGIHGRIRPDQLRVGVQRGPRPTCRRRGQPVRPFAVGTFFAFA